jgi:hypothetical protein
MVRHTLKRTRGMLNGERSWLLLIDHFPFLSEFLASARTGPAKKYVLAR